MTLFQTPEMHAANPPDSWRVRKVAERSWQLVDKAGGVLHTATTKREAEQLKLSGFYVAMYEKEGRWFAGESIPGWKPYQAKESREADFKTVVLEGHSYELWSDGERVGFKVTHRDGAVEYVYLAPSLHHRPGHEPTPEAVVFIHRGNTDPDLDADEGRGLPLFPEGGTS